jgi:hypothetical protein
MKGKGKPQKNLSITRTDILSAGNGKAFPASGGGTAGRVWPA